MGIIFFLFYCKMLYQWFQGDTLGIVDDFIRVAVPLGIVMSALTWGPLHRGFSPDDEVGKLLCRLNRSYP
ncbi:hypothetical protein AB6A23_27260 [Paenibacillus tarimensis]